MRSFMKIGKPPEPVKLPDPSNPQDAQLWLNEVKQRSDEMADDLGFLKSSRRASRDELHGEIKRRPVTKEELQQFFLKQQIMKHHRDDCWCLAVLLAMTGARGGEILSAPSELVMIGQDPCIDLRKVGTKTANGSHLIPVIDELEALGFCDYAA
ncbi:site-specific integrase [Saccharibacter floricola]|nr:hypothetical protein [Saccharibacter floricola]